MFPVQRQLAVIVLSLAATPAIAATLTVNSLADDTIVGDGLVTLREAIAAATFDQQTDLGHNGAGADTIVIALSGTIAPASPLPAISTPIAIVGPGRDALTLTAASQPASAQRMFFVAGGELHLEGLSLVGGIVRGGPGGTCQQRSGCGGGGAGLGAVVLVNHGALSIAGAVVRGGAVSGGDGGSRSLPAGNNGGGGGGGIGGVGGAPGAPTAESGGTGGSGAPLSSLIAPSGQTGAPGAGGGGGNQNLGSVVGGGGGFGGGGGGGGRIAGQNPAGGVGGFGGGGGGRGATGAADGLGAAGGTFGGAGGPSSGVGNTGGGGGGAGGLGGCVFVRAGRLEVADTRFENCLAVGGAAGSHFGGNPGQSGLGKGGALFLADGVDAILANVQFAGNDAGDSTGSSFVPGGPADTDDVFGIARRAMFASGFE